MVHVVGQPLRELTHLLVGLFALGDVLDNPGHAARLARGIRAMMTGGPNPADLSVGAPDAALEIPVALGCGGPAELRVHLRTVFRQHVLQEHFVGPLRKQFRIAKDAVVFERAKGGMIHDIEVPCAGMAGLEGKPQPVFVLT